jgi:hypothetical protein
MIAHGARWVGLQAKMADDMDGSFGIAHVPEIPIQAGAGQPLALLVEMLDALKDPARVVIAEAQGPASQ